MLPGDKLTPTHVLNILLADDDTDDCLFFKEALEELPVRSQLTAVHDGERLMHILKKSGQLPDILFLDLNMPRKNGFTCLEEIKKDSELKHIPVFILTTSFDEKIANSLYQNGALYYICKPPDFNELKKMVGLAISLIAEDNIPTTEQRMIFTQQCNSIKS